MNFTEAVAEVMDIVKRPDKLGFIRREVNAAIAFYCLDNEFPRDFIEQAVAIDPAETAQSFTLATLTRWRKFRYIKRAGTKQFLTILGNAELEKDCILHDRYYVVGNVCNIAMTKLASSLDVGYYSYPPILSAEETFWLLDAYPFMIIDRAAASVFRNIGDEKSMQAHARDARDTYMTVRKDLATNQ